MTRLELALFALGIGMIAATLILQASTYLGRASRPPATIITCGSYRI